MTRLLRHCMVAGAAVAVVGLALVAPAAATSTPTQLVLPQSAAFGVLGHSCGGIQEQTYATQFDPSSGFPTGAVYLKTTCAGSGRGGRSTTYTAWASAMWDFTGALVTSGAMSSAPSVDPAFTSTDANGNEIYNDSAKAYLALGPSFVPAPRITSLSVAVGPAAGGTSVTIDGTGFSAATSVAFGPTPAASFTINGPDSLTAVSAPASAGTVDVTVSSAGGPSTTSAIDQFTLVAAPVVTTVSPNHGPVGGGTLLTITGSHLDAVSAVFMGDQQVGFTSVSDTEITLVTPVGENPDSLQVHVVSVGGTSATSAATQFTYLAPGPTFRATPGVIAPGATIKFSGTGFQPAETIKVTYKTGLRAPHPSSVVLCTVKASSAGSFSCKGAIRAATAGAKGLHAVTARGSTSHRAVTLKVKLT